MKRTFTLLRMADPAEGGDNNSDTPPADTGKKTSKDIVAGDDKRIKKLEEHISSLQDQRKTDRTLIEEMQVMLSKAKEAPSVRLPGKSLLDELEEFMGLSKNEETTQATQNNSAKA
jgi:hypothetical protein